MASIYERKGSKFYWVKYRNPLTGKQVRESTKFVRGTADGRRRALLHSAGLSRTELESPRANSREMWQAWVPAFLESKYQDSPATRTRAKSAWAAIGTFMLAKRIAAPRMLDYATVEQYMDWRKGEKSGLRKVKHNTALLEISYLNVIMRQAVKLGYAPANPCRELDVSRATPKRKDEITEAHIALIESALPFQPIWMAEHWMVLMCQGCRCSEAFTPLDEINEAAGTIRFRIKGGRFHTAPLHKDLMALVNKARIEKRKFLVEPDTYAPRRWWKLFRSLGMTYSLHCTRVTVITRLLRAGFTTAEVCAYIGHTEEVNAIYRRLNPADVAKLGAALGVSANPNAGRHVS